jgi:LysM repeat protein
MQTLFLRRWVSEDALGAMRRALFAILAGAAVGMLAPQAASLHAAPGVAPRAPRLGQLGAHVVQEGDTLFSLASAYDMGVHELALLNGTDPTAYLLPGRSLWVPLSAAVNARADTPARGSVSASDAGETQASSVDDEGDRDAELADDASDTTTVSASTRTTYEVQPGDTLYALSTRFGVSIEDLKRWNGLPLDGSLIAGETLVLDGQGDHAVAAARPPEGSTETHQAYTVARGDTLSAIAARFGTTAAGLRGANGLVGDTIREGQTLLVPRAGSGAAPAGGAKRIEIDVSEQRMYVWQGNTLVWNWPASTGMSTHPTRRGSFAVQSKIPNAWSGPWQLWMPNWLGIYWAGGSENGIHALPIVNGRRLWAGYLGTPISYGCVVLGIAEAEMLYHWAEIGTPVIIRD